MLSFAYDDATVSLVVIRRRGPPPTDEDNERLVAALRSLRRHARGAAVAILAFGEGDGPNAKWRRRFADFKAEAGPVRIALVTTSALYRGVLVAMNWMKPSTAEQRTMVVETAAEGRQWLESECDRPLALGRLCFEARKQMSTTEHAS